MALKTRFLVLGLMMSLILVFSVSAPPSTTSGTPAAAGESSSVTYRCEEFSQCQEIDLVWQRFGEFSSNFRSVWDPNTNRWRTLEEVYPEERAEGGEEETSTPLSSDLIGPTFWCTGDEGLPSATYQDRINQVAWNSEGRTFQELAIEIGNEAGIHPAILAAHMVRESAMRPGPHCTDSAGVQKSALTGCGWPGPCAGARGTPTFCSCSGSDVLSDRAQLQCTADSTYVRNGAIRTDGSYDKCNEYADDPDKHWKCLLCVYQGNYEHAIGYPQTDSSHPYFTRDGTCAYAESFKDSYCQWVNYFEQSGISISTSHSTSSGSSTSSSSSPSSSTPVTFNPVSGAFTFAVVSDYHEGNSNRQKLIASLISQRPKFVVFNGDTVNSADNYEADWPTFFSQIVEPLKNQNIPVVIVLGNHDTEGVNSRLEDFKTIWKDFYSHNSGLYSDFQNFNYQDTVPYYYFDYNGKRFMILDLADRSIGDTQLNWFRTNLQQNSFVFGHIPVVDVQGPPCPQGATDEDYQTCDKYRNLHVQGSSQNNLLQSLDETDSIIFGGHLHYYYKTNYRGANGNTYNVPVVFVSTPKGDNRGITTHRGNDLQPDSYVLVSVGSTVEINAYKLENDADYFTLFNPVDEARYFPTEERLVELRQENLFDPFSVVGNS